MENWKRLYELAGQIQALKPWNTMTESEVFAVRDPVTGKIGFISVMGQEGEHFAVAVYLGERAFVRFLDLIEGEDTGSPTDILEIPQLQLSFEDHEMVSTEDLEILESLELTFQGTNQWPLFRSFRPGMVPWILDETEQQSMIHYLSQMLEVTGNANATSEDREIPVQPGTYLLRDYSYENETPVWKNVMYHVPDLPPLEYSCELPSGLVKSVSTLPKRNSVYELDVFITPARLHPPEERPYFTYILLLVDLQSESVLTYEMLNPSQGLEAMYCSVPGLILEKILEMKARPGDIHVSNELLAGLLTPVLKKSGIQLQHLNKMDILDRARRTMLSFLADMPGEY